MTSNTDKKRPAGNNSNNDKSEAEVQLEELKIATMFRMVEEVTFTDSEDQLTCQMLYLTNKQAMDIPFENMPKVRLAMDVKDPHLVIRLMPSRYGKCFWNAFPYHKERFPEKGFPEVMAEDASTVERQLMLLAKEVLLPLAIKSQALVIVTDSCSLATAFLQVSAPVRRTMGEKCPFRVLLFTRAYFLDAKAHEKQSNARFFGTKAVHGRRPNLMLL